MSSAFNSKRKNLTLALVILIFLAAAVYFLFKNSNNLVTYTNTKYGFTLKFPQEYSLTPCPTLEDQKIALETKSASEWQCFVMNDKNDNKVALVGVDQNPTNLTAKEWVDRSIKDKELGFDAFDFTSKGEIAVKGGSAYELVNDTGSSIHITLFYQLGGQKMLDIRYEYSKGDSEFKNVTDAIIKSITSVKQ